MTAWSPYDEPTTTSNGKGLSAYAFAYQLCIRVIGLRITFDYLALIVDGFAFVCNTFEFLAQLCIAYASIDLRHAEGTVTEQSADNFRRDILVDEAHAHGMPKLVSGKMVQLPCAVFDLLLHSPCIECNGKCHLLVGTQMG